ncbi:MAG: succinylglutamate desuccinylase/aspartoacylase family protein [Alphaproteobacteria bacterium]
MAKIKGPISRIATDIDFDKNGKQISYLAVPSSTNESAYGIVTVPIAVIKNGRGPTVFFSAGVHGDEYEGQVTIRKLVRKLKPSQIQGRIICVPSMNLPAAMAGKRCSPIDGLNMNRVFPGTKEGTITTQIAHYVSKVLLPLTDVQVDLHSGGTTLEYIPTCIMNESADKKREKRTVEAVKAFGLPIGLIDRKTDHGGLFEMEAEEMGILAINTELGGAGRVDPKTVAMAEHGVLNILKLFGLMDGKIVTAEMQGRAPTRLMHVNDARSHVIAPDAGLYEPFVELGDKIKPGQVLGQVHFLNNLEKAPAPVRATIGGLLLLKRPPGRVERGDIVHQIAVDVK